MEYITDRDIKKLIELKNQWIKHKFTRIKFHDEEHKDYLTPIKRESLLDRVFGIIFKND